MLLLNPLRRQHVNAFLHFFQVPKTKCKQVPKKKCKDVPVFVPRKECKDFPKTVCLKDPIQVKKSLPKKVCFSVPEQARLKTMLVCRKKTYDVTCRYRQGD